MEELIHEIQDHFAARFNGIRPLSCLQKWPAYTYRQFGEFGLAVRYDKHKEIFEEANQVMLYTQLLTTGNETHKYLLLVCCDEQYRNKFAELSYDFVDSGYNGDKRKALMNDPIGWWNQWTNLLGDHKSSRSSYDIIAELLTLDFLYKNDNSVRWSASESGTHDIESDTSSFEVKSTVKKSETAITISSQHQLASNNPLYLFFFRMEKSLSGYSINDVVHSLVTHGYDENLLEAQLEKKGYVKGGSIRDLRYTILETRKFEVNQDFPKIVETSFKNNRFPNNITKIIYTIDLEGISYLPIYLANDLGTNIMTDSSNTQFCHDSSIPYNNEEERGQASMAADDEAI